MSKSPISFTPEASPISSPLTPKTFDFPPSSLQKATDEFEQQGEIAQQRALTKEEEEEKLLKQAALDKLETEQDVLYQCYEGYATPQHMSESIAYFFEKKIFTTYYSKIICNGQEEIESGSRLDKTGIYQAAVEKYLLPIMHGFDIIFEKLSSIFSGTSKPTGIVLDYLGGDYDVSLLEAMEFITLELDPEITHTITDTITDYLGANWQQADIVD